MSFQQIFANGEDGIDVRTLISFFANPTIKDRDLTAPPGGESNGDAYLVGASATGDWSGQDGNFAIYLTNETGYIFFAPVEGVSCWVDDEDIKITYDGTNWLKEVVADSLGNATLQTTGDTSLTLERVDTDVVAGNGVSHIAFKAGESTPTDVCAIYAQAGLDYTATSYPTRLKFHITENGTTTSTEMLRLDVDKTATFYGPVTANKTGLTSFFRAQGANAELVAIANDGTLDYRCKMQARFAEQGFRLQGGSDYNLITADGFATPNNLKLYTSNTLALTLDSSQNASFVGTGTFNQGDSGATADTDGDDLIVENSGDAGMSILGGTTSNCTINFGDSDDANIGYITYDNNDDSLAIGVNAGAFLTVDSSRNPTFNSNTFVVSSSDLATLQLKDGDTVLSDAEISCSLEFFSNDTSNPDTLAAAIRTYGNGSIGNCDLEFHTGLAGSISKTLSLDALGDAELTGDLTMSGGDLVLTGGGFTLGYATGAGGAITQTTSRTTGVTLNTATGAITLVSAAGTTSWQTFTVTNSVVAATDTIIVNQKSGTDLNMIHVTAVAAGSFDITFATTGGTTTEQPVFNFSVITGVTA